MSCPDCYLGRAAREQVLGPDLLPNLGAALLPFAIIFALCLRLERGRS